MYYSSYMFGGEASISGMCGVVEKFGNNSNEKSMVREKRGLVNRGKYMGSQIASGVCG